MNNSSHELRDEDSHMLSNTAWTLPARQNEAVLSSRPILNVHSSQPSVSSIDSALSGSTTSTVGPQAPGSIFFRSTSKLGSSPSLASSLVKSSETLNYDPTRRMSVRITPIYESKDQERYADKIATKVQLDALTCAYPLPELATGKRNERWRNFRYDTMSAYMRLWLLVILINISIIVAMIVKLVHHPGSFTYGDAATATGANLLLAALMRHEHCVNLLFRLATALPHSTPLFIRRHAAKVYSYGGVHSGCGLSALLWYVFYTYLALTQFHGSRGEEIALATTSVATLLCLCVIIGLAHPEIRRKRHNQWEVSHRFAGWTAIGLVWAQTLVIVIAAAHHASQDIGLVLAKTPTFWFLVVITCCLIYPWLRLRRRKVEAEVLSSHAVRLWFGERDLPSCVGARLSHKPLTENHGFATIPNAKSPSSDTPTPSDLEAGLAHPETAHLSDEPRPPARGRGYSVLVSKAGDWTSDLIAHPPSAIWTRGAPTRGVLHVAHCFRPVVVVATGSGIGPCLSFLQAHPHYPVRVIWSARTPVTTYGAEILDAVLRADARAVIIDTAVVKRPDLPGLSWALARQTAAEAVVIISNPPVTRTVVFGLEARGLPAFGAIFDS